MLKEAVTYKNWNESPPFQPFVIRFANSYQEEQLSWNPHCVKKDALFYQFVTGGKEEEIELIPDACLNVLFELGEADPCARFSGTFLQPKVLTLKPNTTYFGFKPYSNLGFKTPLINFKEMADSHTDFNLVFPCAERLLTEIAEAADFDERTCVFTRFAWDFLVDHAYSPTFIDYMTVILCSSHGHIVFNNIEQVIGYSERHCREKFKDCYGISPKQYSDIIRFQTTLKALMFGTCKDLSTLAIECGYFDQSHLTHDFKRYTDKPPGKYLERHVISSAILPKAAV
jgi:AraC-like DNA-binding protein